MISEDAKSRIDSLSEEELRYEVDLGAKSRFQREKFAYVQSRLSELEAKKLQETSQASNPTNESWISRHTGALITALATIVAAIIGGVFLFTSQTPSSIENQQSSFSEIRTDKSIDSHTESVVPSSTTALDEVNPGAVTDSSSKVEFEAVTDPNYHPITLKEYFSTWYEGELTDLQRDEFEASILNKRVVWEGTVDKISSDSDGKIDVQLEPNDGSYGTAFLEFDPEHRSLLLNIKERQKLRVSCVVRGFVVSPFLEKCSIIRVLK